MPDSIVVSWNKVDEWTVKIIDDDGNILLWHKDMYKPYPRSLAYAAHRDEIQAVMNSDDPKGVLSGMLRASINNQLTDLLEEISEQEHYKKSVEDKDNPSR